MVDRLERRGVEFGQAIDDGEAAPCRCHDSGLLQPGEFGARHAGGGVDGDRDACVRGACRALPLEEGYDPLAQLAGRDRPLGVGIGFGLW